jgi:predicted transcriptional regulator
LIYEIQELAENKLIILYILNRINMPITDEQLSKIVLDNRLMNYFYLKQYIDELIESGFVMIEEEKYHITEKGIEILKLFFTRIPFETRQKIDEYILLNKEKIKQESQYIATYYKKAENQYIANCKVVENGIVLIELNINVVNSEQAKLICDNWKQKSQDVYAYIIKALTGQ